eukprot:scaffold3443_cov404-Prasinococcus_capsulatus_cf.AAC.20
MAGRHERAQLGLRCPLGQLGHHPPSEASAHQNRIRLNRIGILGSYLGFLSHHQLPTPMVHSASGRLPPRAGSAGAVAYM